MTPELTTVAQPIKEMGKCAVQMILGTVKELPRDRAVSYTHLDVYKRQE